MSAQVTSTVKYGFRIRTRHGLLVEHLSIHGRDEADAEKKLRQMYLHCEIIDRRVLLAPAATSFRPVFKSS
jgi:hypothetical protein